MMQYNMHWYEWNTWFKIVYVYNLLTKDQIFANFLGISIDFVRYVIVYVEKVNWANFVYKSKIRFLTAGLQDQCFGTELKKRSSVMYRHQTYHMPE